VEANAGHGPPARAPASRGLIGRPPLDGRDVADTLAGAAFPHDRLSRALVANKPAHDAVDLPLLTLSMPNARTHARRAGGDVIVATLAIAERRADQLHDALPLGVEQTGF